MSRPPGKRGSHTTLALNLRYWQRPPGVCRYRVERGRVVGDLGNFRRHLADVTSVRLSDPLAAIWWVVRLEQLGHAFDEGTGHIPPHWVARLTRNLELAGFHASDDRAVVEADDPNSLVTMARWSVGSCLSILQGTNSTDNCARRAELCLRHMGIKPYQCPWERRRPRNPEKKMRTQDRQREAKMEQRWPTNEVTDV